jgi:prolyl-tRNA synthetase
MGALVMTHSDDQGLVLPPNLAPYQVVIVPIYRGEEQLEQISAKVADLQKALRSKGIRVKYDNRDTHKPGWKFAEYELKGVPMRIAIGPRDLENNTVELARRDTLSKEVVAMDGIADLIQSRLEDIQSNLLKKANDFRAEHSYSADDYEDFKAKIEAGGFVYAHWDGTAETEEKIKGETKATIRCIPLDQKEESGKCIYSGKPSSGRVIFAKAY